MHVKKNKVFVFLLFTLFLINNVKSQKASDLYAKLKENKDSITNFSSKKIDSLLTLGYTDSIYLPKIAHLFSVQFYKKRKNHLALKYANIEVDYLEQNGQITKEYEKALYNSGRFYYYNDEYDRSIERYLKVIEIGLDDKKTAQSYCEIGRCYRRKGEFFKSFIFSKRGIALLEKLNEQKSLVPQYVNIALAYENVNTKQSLRKGLLALKKADSLIRINTKLQTKRNKYIVNAGFGNHYSSLPIYDFEKSKGYYMSNLVNGLKDKDDYIVGNAYINLGELYLTEKKDSALFFLRKSIEHTVDNDNRTAESYRNIANYYEVRVNHEDALINIQKSLVYSTKVSKDWKVSPSFIQLLNTSNRRNIIRALNKKVDILIALYEKEKKEIYLQTAIQTVNATDSLVNIIQKSSTEDKTKLLWRQDASKSYIKGAYIAALLKDYKMTFRFMEKNKAILLIEGIIKNTVHNNLPNHISEVETLLQKKIYELENKEKNTVTVNAKKEIENAVFKAKNNHARYIDSIKKLYPTYFKSNIDIQQVSISEVQKNMIKDEIIISYIFNELNPKREVLFGLAILKDSVTSFQIEVTQGLKQNLKKYTQLVSKPLVTTELKDKFKETAYEIYTSLFPNEFVRKRLKGKKVIIVPDGELQNIPFEALITKEDSESYLLYDSTISYAYSISFLAFNEQIKRETSKNLMSYAPIRFKDSLAALTLTKSEVQSIEKHVAGEVRLYEDASKEHFLKMAGDSKIIHLATHANASDDPWIAFSNAKLNLHELYTFKNNADLVTLSACSTSIGEIAQGEGTLSLARGFFYSGAKSVVSSLWEVNDASTAFLMSSFYKNLEVGQKKSEALNNAKKEYLTQHSLSEKSPYYWSSFVLIGDSNTIYFSNTNNYYWIIVFIGAILLWIFLRKKRKDKKG